MSLILTENLLEEVYNRTQKKDRNGWRHVLKYGESLEIKSKRKLLWVWPDFENIANIGNLFKELSIKTILSVGCGNGLLEWLLKESLDVEVYGLEIDRNWWQSQYTIKPFISLNYVEDLWSLGECHKKQRAFLQNCCYVSNWNFALLFCYFNNHEAFLHYLKLYKGEWIIIIGPSTKSNNYVYTEPMPLQPNFAEKCGKKWNLNRTLYIGDHDILALYQRK